MKKYSAFFVAPIVAVMFIVAVLKGPHLLQHIESMAGVSQAFLDYAKYLLTLVPATIFAIVLGFPIFYLIRWIADWKLLPCMLGGLLVLGSVSLILEQVAITDVTDLVADKRLLAVLVGTLAYGLVFWILMEKYQEPDQDK
jgi:hypothetical protein